MSAAPLVKIQAATAAEVCSRFNLPPTARALLREGMEPPAFVAALVANKQYAAGIDFLAHALPAREGIWWAYLCMQHACGGVWSEPERAALIAGVRWVLQPGEENRAAAKASAPGAGLASLPGLLAMAVFLTGSSAGPSKSLAIAAKTAATRADPGKLLDTQRLFVNLGIEVAEGRII
jgi:hypothetical protein